MSISFQNVIRPVEQTYFYIFAVSFRCYKAVRKARLAINDESIEITVNLGCPQGGVLFPILWGILIDGLLRTTFPFLLLFVAYADDITVGIFHKDPLIATRYLQIV